jgi:hypothetical protein
MQVWSVLFYCRDKLYFTTKIRPKYLWWRNLFEQLLIIHIVMKFPSVAPKVYSLKHTVTTYQFCPVYFNIIFTYKRRYSKWPVPSEWLYTTLIKPKLQICLIQQLPTRASVTTPFEHCTWVKWRCVCLPLDEKRMLSGKSIWWLAGEVRLWIYYCTWRGMGRPVWVPPPVVCWQRHRQQRSHSRLASRACVCACVTSPPPLTLLPLPLLISHNFPASIFTSFILWRNSLVCFDEN